MRLSKKDREELLWLVGEALTHQKWLLYKWENDEFPNNSAIIKGMRVKQIKADMNKSREIRRKLEK